MPDALEERLVEEHVRIRELLHATRRRRGLHRPDVPVELRRVISVEALDGKLERRDLERLAQVMELPDILPGERLDVHAPPP